MIGRLGRLLLLLVLAACSALLTVLGLELLAEALVDRRRRPVAVDDIDWLADFRFARPFDGERPW